MTNNTNPDRDLRALTIECDAAGILTLCFADPSRPMNVLADAVIAELRAAVESAAADARVKGVLIRSAKTSFIVGADLKELVTAYERGITAAQGYAMSQALSQIFRRLETLGKPVAVAINGTALGGGLELCLACHHRVLSSDPKAGLGLPEVKVGLLPGAGGTQRLPRLLGIGNALPLLAEGGTVKPDRALSLGLVHALAPADETVQRAREWLLTGPEPIQPWDRKGFALPGGGVASREVIQTFMMASALVAKSTQHNYPAPIAILSAVYEGCNVPIDTGLKIESRYFGKLIADPTARNMMRTLFINKGAADKLAHRPTEFPRSAVAKLGVLGAGMMGAGIAYVAALANGGTLYYLQHPTTKDEVATFEPKVKRTLDIARYVPDLQDGMAGAVEYGTARRLRVSFNELPIFGKTGTCSNNGTRLGWFAAFSDSPQGSLVTVFFLEGGRATFGPAAAGLTGLFYKNLWDRNYFAGTGVQDAASIPAASSQALQP